MIVVHSCPRKNGTTGNYCAYCHFWEGDAGLQSATGGTVKFESTAKGYCVFNGRRSLKEARYGACHDFQLSNNASRYAK